jgi:hypothetical protein
MKRKGRANPRRLPVTLDKQLVDRIGMLREAIDNSSMGLLRKKAALALTKLEAIIDGAFTEALNEIAPAIEQELPETSTELPYEVDWLTKPRKAEANEERVDVTIDSNLARRLETLVELIKVSSIEEVRKSKLIEQLDLEDLLDSAVDGFLEGIVGIMYEFPPK